MASLYVKLILLHYTRVLGGNWTPAALHASLKSQRRLKFWFRCLAFVLQAISTRLSHRMKAALSR